MIKVHENQGTRKVLTCAVCASFLHSVCKRFLIILSLFVAVVTCPASAVNGYTEYNTFPTMSGVDYMKENSVYKNAAVAGNMLGITSGEIVAVPVYITVSCPENQYLTNENACVACPDSHPKSNGGAGGIAVCYKIVARGCTQKSCACSDNSSCTCATCSCVPVETYVEYHDGTTSGTTTNMTCNQTVATTTCNAGYYLDNGGCSACHVSFTNTGSESCDIAHATGSTKSYTQTCYHNESVAGSTSSAACTGTADCGAKTYGTCYVGSCDNGYHKNQTTNATSCVADTYTITYNLNGGTNNGSNPASYTIETNTITLGAPTKTGYTFGGWYDNSELTGTAVTQIAKGTTGNKTFWAKWTSASYSCAAGQYLPKGSTECAQCLVNNYCEANGYNYSTTQDQGLVACHVSFTNTGSESCDIAHATGSTKSYTQTCYHNESVAGSTSSVACTGTADCGAKTYGACVPTGCEAGYYLSNGACVEVGLGYYSADGAIGRTKCPDAYPSTVSTTSATVTACYKTVTRGCTQNSCSCPGNATCTCDACACAGGTYIQYVNAAGNGNGATSGTTANETCNQTVSGATCGAGYYMNNGTCVACAKGTYKATAGNATSCTVASEGYYVSTTGATAQTQCPAGYRDGSNGGRDDITDCYKNVTRGCTQSEGSVPNNCQSVTAWNACTCAGGTYNRHVAANGTSEGEAEGTSTNETCTKTPSAVTAKSGYYVNGTSCAICPNGWSSSAVGNTGGVTACYKTVTRGCTQNPCSCQGDSTCVCADCKCAGETYTQYVAANGSSNGETSGTSTNETCNQTVATTTCNAGYYMNNGTCVACAKGTYKSESGNATSCTVASDGYYVSTTGATAQTQCPAGYRDGSNGGRDDITDCYKTVTRGCTQSEGSVPNNCQSVTAWNACTCAGGTYNRHVAANGTSEGEAEGTSTNETCTKTPSAVTAKSGYYVNGTSCSTCPSGWSSSAAGNTGGITACYKTVTRGCTQNSCSCPGNATCTCDACACAGGTYIQYVNAAGNGNGATSGTTANETCNQTVSGATCGAGYYMNNGTCTACAKGTYKATAGNATSCTVASEGYYVSTTGATAQTQCPAGLVSPRGTTSAGACGKMMYVDNTKLYLTKEKQTAPALAVKIDGVVYYAKTTPVSGGAKPMNSATTKSLRTKIDGVEYSIHDNTVQGE